MSEENKSLNFLEHIIEEDLNQGMPEAALRFRFPPEPNGYLHIGHTKAIGISFGLGERYHAPVNLRFDDTNPTKEDQEYVDAIKEDIQWLGYTWDKECYTSDYFQQLYDWAVQLVQQGHAYVDSQSSEAMAEQKGTPTEPGIAGPYRERSVAENLDLLEGMRKGEFEEGSHVLRAKIDMAHTNMLMRDPLMYRILKKEHHRTSHNWCIYPMYDWAHGESDYIEQVSHSLCSLEFKPHRELYEWFLSHIHDERRLLPKQREFARLNLNYTVMSKRKLLQLVEMEIVNGWDDPRMPTISGLRRRGYTPTALRKFVETVGVAKRDNIIDVSLLEFCIREDLNASATRVMAVLDPVKLIIDNYPEGQVEWLESENNPEDSSAGIRKIPFSKELYIEREDFKESASNKFFRLTLDKEVRLKNAYIIKGTSVIKDDQGRITEIHCEYDPDSKSGSGTEASLRKVKGTLHWVSAAQAITAEVRLYDRLFSDEAPDGNKERDFKEFINPNSLKKIVAYLEPDMGNAQVMEHFQFQRLGYFNVDKDSSPERLVFNRTVGLKDSWAKAAKSNGSQKTASKVSEANQSSPKNHHQADPLTEIKKSGKKYTNLPPEKQAVLKERLLEHGKSVQLEELVPLFDTAVKKTGTRIAVMLALTVVLEQENLSKEHDEAIGGFIEKGLMDKHPVLRMVTLELLSGQSDWKTKYKTELENLLDQEEDQTVKSKLSELV